MDGADQLLIVFKELFGTGFLIIAVILAIGFLFLVYDGDAGK